MAVEANPTIMSPRDYQKMIDRLLAGLDKANSLLDEIEELIGPWPHVVSGPALKRILSKRVKP